jgi:hypothetical protein
VPNVAVTEGKYLFLLFILGSLAEASLTKDRLARKKHTDLFNVCFM